LAAPIRGLALEPEQGSAPQLITGIDGSGRVVAADRDGDGDGNGAGGSNKGPLVIAPLANTYRGPAGAAAARAGRGGFVPSFVPPSAAQDAQAGVGGGVAEKFVAAAAPTEDERRRAAATARYGLELRAPPAAGAAAGGAAAAATAEAAPEAAEAAATEAAGAPPPPPPPQQPLAERQRLEHDLKSLPEPAPREAYEALPVEEFGKALLRGLGWREGEGVGRKRQKVELKDPVRRPERLGLGADPAAVLAAAAAAQKTLPVKMGDKKPEAVAAAGGGGGRAEARPGSGGGREERRRGGEKEEDEERRRRRHHRSRSRSRSRERDRRDHRRSSSHHLRRSRSRSRSPGGGGRKDRRSSHHREAQRRPPSPPRPPPPCWLLPGIRVRVVDRRLDGGRAYCRKGRVVEVHPGPTADVALEPLPTDGGGGAAQLLSLVPQAALETVVPKQPGQPVVVLRGEHRGERATLLEARPDAGVAAVQLAEDLGCVLRLLLDDFAEAVGVGGG
jgi:G patch domain/KOW motif-containing protein